MKLVSEIFWVLAVLVLCALIGAFATHWSQHRCQALAYLHSPAMFPFYGAVAMALLTVGSATGITGPDFLGHDVAITVSLTLWTLGTALGLVTYVVMMIRLVRDAGMATAMPFWLMPVVPPMVSATTGAAVSTHMPEGAPRIAVLVFCYILFALALTAAIGILVAVARQFARNPFGRRRRDPVQCHSLTVDSVGRDRTVDRGIQTCWPPPHGMHSAPSMPTPCTNSGSPTEPSSESSA